MSDPSDVSRRAPVEVHSDRLLTSLCENYQRAR